MTLTAVLLWGAVAVMGTVCAESAPLIQPRYCGTTENGALRLCFNFTRRLEPLQCDVELWNFGVEFPPCTGEPFQFLPVPRPGRGMPREEGWSLVGVGHFTTFSSSTDCLSNVLQKFWIIAFTLDGFAHQVPPLVNVTVDKWVLDAGGYELELRAVPLLSRR